MHIAIRAALITTALLSGTGWSADQPTSTMKEGRDRKLAFECLQEPEREPAL